LETCGWTISAVHVTVTVCADPQNGCTQFVTLVDQVQADFDQVFPGIEDGDSGGPVYSYDANTNLWATGIVSAKDPSGTRMLYSFFANAVRGMNVFLCASGAC